MLPPAQLLQSAFIATSCTIIFVNAVPDLGSRFIDYGLRATPSKGRSKDENANDRRATGRLSTLLDKIAATRVPHGSFKHFYIVSNASSLCWAFQILCRGSLLQAICRAQNDGGKGSMTMDQVALAWSLMAIQGGRRVIESYLVAKHSASKMWFIHWYLGIAFYLAMGVAVWIEGADTLLRTESPWRDITFTAPSLRTLLCIPIFLVASGIQHDCHVFLASLPKYTLPTSPIFNSIVCPHYTAECLIYASFAFIAAPRGAMINRTLFSVLLFVAINLSITASATKKWYAQKFGVEKVEDRWKIIPGVY